MLLRLVICSNHKSNHDKFKSIPNQITTYQITSILVVKSNHKMWFNHSLNQITIWICPSLLIVSESNKKHRTGRYKTQINWKKHRKSITAIVLHLSIVRPIFLSIVQITHRMTFGLVLLSEVNSLQLYQMTQFHRPTVLTSVHNNWSQMS